MKIIPPLTLGEKTILRFSIVLGSIVLVLLLPYIVPMIAKQIIGMPLGLRYSVFLAIIIVIEIILILIFSTIAHVFKFYNNVDAYLHKKMREKIMEKQRRIERANEEYKHKRISGRKMYSIVDIQSNSQPMSFIIELNQVIKSAFLPIVNINNIPVGSTTAAGKLLYCYGKKVLTAHNDRVLKFSIGDNVYEILNPYYVDNIASEKVQWQCEGHGEDRKILLPLSYLPQAQVDVQYPFNLKVNGAVSSNYLIGTYDQNTKQVVIPLGKDSVHRRDLHSGKQAVLVLGFSRANKVLLPMPSIISEEILA